MSVLRMCVDVRKGVNKRNKLGTEFPLQVIDLLRQLVSFRGVFLLFGLISQLTNFAIDLALELVAADDFDDILCVLLQLGSIRLLPRAYNGTIETSKIPMMSSRFIGAPVCLTSIRATIMPAAENS